MGNSSKDNSDKIYQPEKHDPIIFKLIQTIINEQDGSIQQRYAFRQLLRYFYLSPKLPQLYVKHDLKQDLFDDAYNRATMALTGISLNKGGTTKKSSQKMNSNPIRSLIDENTEKDSPETIRVKLVALFKTILNNKIQDIHRENKKYPASLDEVLSADNKETRLDTLADVTISGLDKLIMSEQESLYDKIVDYIDNDPKGKLKDCHPRNRQECNCQALLRRRLIDGETNISKLAEEFNISRQTLQGYLDYADRPKRADAKCFRLLKKEIESFYQINLNQNFDEEEE